MLWPSQLRIIRTLLQAEGTPYSVKVVAGWEELSQALRSLGPDWPVCALLINCGGVLNIQKEFGESLGLGEGSRIYVVDSMRPTHLRNIDPQNKDVVVLQPDEETAYGPSIFDYDSDNDENDDDDDDEEDDAREAWNDGRRKAQKTEAKRLAHDYYGRGLYYGRAAGVIMYELAYAAQAESLGEHLPLWCACVAIADQFLSGKASQAEYGRRAEELAARIGVTGQGKVSVTRREKRFFLLRHWSLFEAMVHSPYVGPLLHTWRQEGKDAVRLVLAEMGISKAHYERPFVHMPPRAKRVLEERLPDAAERHGLDDLCVMAFERDHGARLRVSSLDAAHALSALLARPAGRQEAFLDAARALDVGGADALADGIERAKLTQRALFDHLGRLLLAAQGTALQARRNFRVADLELVADPTSAERLSHPSQLVRFASLVQASLPGSAKPLLVFAPVVAAKEEQQKEGEEDDEDAEGGQSVQQFVRVIALNSKPAPKDTDRYGAIFASLVSEACNRLETSSAFRNDEFDTSTLVISRSNKAALRRLVHVLMDSNPSVAAAVEADA